MKKLVCLSLLFIFLSCEYGGERENVEKQSTIIKVEKQSKDSKSFVEEVQNLIKQGRFFEAREILEIQLSENPENHIARFLLIDVSFLEENYKSAKILSSEINSQNPYEISFKEKSSIASLLMQELSVAKEGFENILEEVEKIIKKEQKEGNESYVCNPMQCCIPAKSLRAITQVNLATTFYSMRNLENADAIINGVLYEKPDFDCAKFTKALILSKREFFEDSAKKYQEILEKHPFHAPSLNNLGVIRYMERDFESARKYFESAYQYAGFDSRTAAIAWQNIGELEIQEGRYSSAEKYFREAMEISPTYAGAYFNLGVVLDITGKMREAKSAIKKALELDPQGVVRFNSYTVNEEWRWYEEALISEVQGNKKQATSLWIQIINGKVPALVEPAKKHLPKF